MAINCEITIDDRPYIVSTGAGPILRGRDLRICLTALEITLLSDEEILAVLRAFCKKEPELDAILMGFEWKKMLSEQQKSLIARTDILSQELKDQLLTPEPPKIITKSNRTRDNSGFVYFLEGGGFTKIGVTQREVDHRITEIHPILPFQVNVICSIATSDVYDLEAKLHRKFATKRTNGEWFVLDKEDMEYIRSLADEEIN